MTLSPKLLNICILAYLLGAITFRYFNKNIYFFDTNYCKGLNMTDVIGRLNSTSGLHETTALKETESKQCEICSEGVPNLIIQYGAPRTATTLQFQILCLMMAFLHEDKINDVGCYFRKTKTVKVYNVIKCHYISKLLTTIPSNSWVFMTSSDLLSPQQKSILNASRGKIKERNITIPLTADVDLVSRRGHFIVYEYQHLFGVSDENMQHIVEYFRYWDILRVCCGKQMSADWRNRLSQTAKYKQHHDSHSSTYPACEMYNISQVEHLLLNTYIFRKLSHIGSLRNVIGKTSTVDGILDGNYCERCNANISKQHLKFNWKCA